MFTNNPMRLILAALALAWAGAGQAGDIYQWTDEKGRTHLSDTVPQQYRKSATRHDTRQYELTEEQRREADARAAREGVRQRAAVQESERGAGERAAPAARSAASAASAGKLPAHEDACAKAWREYREKELCFGPFRTANQGIKAEAFAICGPDMVSPADRCPPD